MMWPFNQSKWKYSSVIKEESDDDYDLSQSVIPRSASPKRRWWGLITAVLVSVVCLVVGFESGIFMLSHGILARFRSHHQPVFHDTGKCGNPPIRREWRSLSMVEKHNYLNAVQCLSQTPSRLGTDMTLYDDFPHVHDTLGAMSHDAAPFLAWHRYFIHIYEKALQEQCGYEGVLTYWDWTLDWEDPINAPVWDPHHGFGGDSQPHSHPNRDVVVGEDRCVVDGPFAGLEVHWFGEHDNPHCLSRGFRDGQLFTDVGHRFGPDAIDRALQHDNFTSFFLELEHGPHLAIPQGVGGDFFFTVAPYDPVFFLHHTQLDRLWWRWQQTHPSRLMEYSGPSSHESNKEASLDDILPVGKLAESLPVREVMSTESDLLCYRY